MYGLAYLSRKRVVLQYPHYLRRRTQNLAFLLSFQPQVFVFVVQGELFSHLELRAATSAGAEGQIAIGMRCHSAAIGAASVVVFEERFVMLV
jgi:hypothetical protein